jgi:hypothetical protein
MILDDENILMESAKECTTNPIIILKNRVSNRGKFVKEDVLILNEIIEDFNKNNPKYDWLARKIKFNIVDNCINVHKNNPLRDRIFSIQVISKDDVRISFSYIPTIDIVREYMVSKYKLKKFRNLNRVYTLDI